MSNEMEKATEPGPSGAAAVGAGPGATAGRQVEWTCRWSPQDRALRLFRMSWPSGTTDAGRPARSRLSVGLRPSLLRVVRMEGAVSVTLAFVRVHYVRTAADRFH